MLNTHSVEQSLSNIFESAEFVPGTDIRGMVNATAPAFGLRPDYFVTVQEAQANSLPAQPLLHTFAHHAPNWVKRAWPQVKAPRAVKPGLTHEEYIQRIRDAAACSPALQEGEKAKILAVKLMYGIGNHARRGVTFFGKWNNGCKDCPTVDLAEVCASGEESPIQVAGTTVHELGHVLAGWSAGHGKEWKEACGRLGLRHVKAAGTQYLMASFQPRIREVIASMGNPQDGKPTFLDGSLAHGKAGVCTMGYGTRGGKSRGVGSGSRMLKVACPEGNCNDGRAYVARVAQGWLEVGAPKCPVHLAAMVRA